MKTFTKIAAACCLAGLLTGYLLADNSRVDKTRELGSRIPDDSTAEAQIEIRKGRFTNELIQATDRKNLIHSSVEAGGIKYELDCRRSPEAEKALLDAAVLTHGDARQQTIYVTGSLKLRPLDPQKPLTGYQPVVSVKTLEVKLEHPGPARLTIEPPIK